MATLELTPQIELPDGSLSSHLDSTYILEGERYGFRFYSIYNIVEDYTRWYFDLFNPDTNESILNGIKMTIGINMLGPYRYKPIPPGALIIADLNVVKYNSDTGVFENPRGFDPKETGFSDQRYKLIYITSDDPLLQTS